MRGRPLLIDWREEHTPEALKAAYQAERDATLRTRLHGLWLVRTGRQVCDVARLVGVHQRTVQQWVAWYREGGLAEVVRHKMGGKGQPRFLSAEQEEELSEEVATGRFRTAWEIKEWIESEYGVSYKGRSVYGLLSRLGCSPKVPRPSHEKANRVAQKAWKKGGLRPVSPSRG